MTNDYLSLFVLTYLLLNATATLNLDKYGQPPIKNVVGILDLVNKAVHICLRKDPPRSMR